MTGFSEEITVDKVTAAEAAVTISRQAGNEVMTVPETDEDVVISSYLVSTVEGETDEVSATISKIAGVEVHETHGTTLVVTIEAPTIDDSTRVATEVNLSKGVISMRMIFANFEDDPVIKAHMQSYLEEQAQKQAQG